MKRTNTSDTFRPILSVTEVSLMPAVTNQILQLLRGTWRKVCELAVGDCLAVLYAYHIYGPPWASGERKRRQEELLGTVQT